MPSGHQDRYGRVIADVLRGENEHLFGWCLNSDLTNGVYTGIGAQSAGDIEFWALWFKLWVLDDGICTVYSSGSKSSDTYRSGKNTITVGVTVDSASYNKEGYIGIIDWEVGYGNLTQSQTLYNVKPLPVGRWVTLTVPEFIMKKAAKNNNSEIYFKLFLPGPSGGDIFASKPFEVRTIGATELY